MVQNAYVGGRFEAIVAKLTDYDFYLQLLTFEVLYVTLITLVISSMLRFIYSIPQTREYIAGALDRVSDLALKSEDRIDLAIILQFFSTGLMMVLFFLLTGALCSGLAYLSDPSATWNNSLNIRDFVFVFYIILILIWPTLVLLYSLSSAGRRFLENSGLNWRQRFYSRAAVVFFGLLLVILMAFSAFIAILLHYISYGIAGIDFIFLLVEVNASEQIFGSFYNNKLKLFVVISAFFLVFIVSLLTIVISFICFAMTSYLNYFTSYIFGGFAFLFLFLSLFWAVLIVFSVFYTDIPLAYDSIISSIIPKEQEEGGAHVVPVEFPVEFNAFLLYAETLVSFLIVVLIGFKIFRLEWRQYSRSVPGAGSIPCERSIISQEKKTGVAINHDSRLPKIFETIDAWIEARRDEIEAARKSDRKYRIFVASAQGGGLYAAWYAAAVFAKLQDRNPQFGRSLFAISAVSGGGLGSHLFTSMISRANKDPEYLGSASSFSRKCERFFRFDFLTPIVGSLFFNDIFNAVLPRSTRSNRATALERAFDRAWDDIFDLSRASSVANVGYFEQSKNLSTDAPCTIINATISNNGMPVVISPFYFSTFDQGMEEIYQGSGIKIHGVQKRGGWDYFRFAHFNNVVASDVPITTAVSLGARFPYVTPGGKFPLRQEAMPEGVQPTSWLSRWFNTPPEVAFSDGGYFDNTGTATA